MKKVLFLSLSGIGNYIMQSPTIAAVKRAHPDWHLTVWVAPRNTYELAKNDPNVDEVIEMPIKTSPTQHVTQIMRLQRERFDIGIVLSPGQHLKSALYMYLAGIPSRIGSTYPLRGDMSAAFLTSGISEKENLHDVEQNLRLLEPLHIATPSNQTYSISIPETNTKETEQILTSATIPAGKRIVGIHPGSAPDLAFKRWPVAQFAKVAIELIEKHDAHILIFGGDNEEDQKKELENLIREKAPDSVATVTASLLTVASVMRGCDLVIANDSGLMHLASATGVRVVGLFGPTNEKLTGPRGSASSAIRAPKTTPVYTTDTIPTLTSDPHPSILALTPELVLSSLTPYL